jgi:SPP1 family predicted phage head-tail adaptor
MPRIGELRERITIQQPVVTTDTQGGHPATWNVVATVYAKVRPFLPRVAEQLSAGAVTAIVHYEITIRYRAAIVPTMRVAWDGKLLRVHGVQNVDALDQWLVLECSEVDRP